MGIINVFITKRVCVKELKKNPAIFFYWRTSKNKYCLIIYINMNFLKTCSYSIQCLAYFTQSNTKEVWRKGRHTFLLLS